MARTIGKHYKNLIEKLVKKAMDDGLTNAGDISEYVLAEMPAEAFDTWESAHDEIQRLVIDLVMNKEG